MSETVKKSVWDNVTKMLELSTAHMKPQTNEWLGEHLESDFDPTSDLVVYEKAEYGWLIYVPHEESDLSSVPEDLRKVLEFAISLKLDWIMFDRDAGEINELPTYEW